jgi:membrane protein
VPLLTPFTDNVELTRGDRKTYAGQAKAQRAKGFERHPFYRHHTAAPA